MSFDSELRTAFTVDERQLPDEAAVLTGIHRAVGRRRRRRAATTAGLVVLALAVAPLGWQAAIDRGPGQQAARPSATPSDLFPSSAPGTSPPPAKPKLSTRVGTVAGYQALSPAPTSCVPGGYPRIAELTAAVSGLLAGAAGTVQPDEASTTCIDGTSAYFTLGAGGGLFVDISYHKGSFAAHRDACRPACGPADVIVQTKEQELPGRLKRAVQYNVAVIRPDDRIVAVMVEPDPAGLPKLTMGELVGLASGQPLASHATVATAAPVDLSAPIR
jgi:hypothetical protein